MILCFVTSRPSYSRVKTVLTHFNEINYNYGVICSASATEDLYGNVSNLIESDGFNLLARFTTQLSATTGVGAVKTTGLSLLSTSDLINQLSPKAVITIADRYETLSTAIAASYQGIPSIHIQGGEKTGNIDDKVRDAVSTLSDIHFPSTTQAASRLKKFVKNPDMVFNYGCPSIDLYMKAPYYTKDFVVKEVHNYATGIPADPSKPYLVVLLHPDTNNIDDSNCFVKRLLLDSLTSEYQIIWFWPNSDPGSSLISKSIRTHRESHPNARISFIKNLNDVLFINLLRHCDGLISNSSVGVREAGVLGIPTIDVGLRQLNRERHSNVTNMTYQADLKSILKVLHRDISKPCYIYGTGQSGRKIANKIAELFS